MTRPQSRPSKTRYAAAVLLSAAFVVPAEAPQASAARGAVAEFPAETAAIVEATASLFASVEAGAGPRRARPAILAPVLATPANLPRELSKADVLTSHGAVDHLTGYRISWYPVDRFLGTVDFMGTWDANRNLVCGYVTWDLSDPERPELVEVSAAFVDVDEVLRNDDEAIDAALLDANCAYGAVEANYAFFD